MPLFAARPRTLTLLIVAALALACRSGEPATGERPPQPAQAPHTDPSSAERRPEPPSLEQVSEDPVVQAMVRVAEADSQVEAHARTLAVDIGSRLTASSGLASAEAWAVERFGDWGLEARVEPWGAFEVGFERGPAHGGVVRPDRRALEFGTSAWSPGTGGVPLRGQALLYPQTDAELRTRRPYLRGAWILIPHTGLTTDLNGGRPGPPGAVGERVAKALNKAGVAGFVWAAGAPNDRLVHTGGDHEIRWGKRPRRVEVQLRGDQHHALVEQLRGGVFVQLEFSIDNHFVRGPLAVNNVIADLPGDSRAEEMVIIGAHLDSWDGAAGAVDNATGVATAMEAARLIALACERTGARPRRTIRVMLWSGEEQGLLGSRAWVTQQDPEVLERISAVLVHDGGTNFLSGLPVTPEMLAEMEAAFAPLEVLEQRRLALGRRRGQELEPMPFHLRVVESLIFEPTDSAPFISADVPGFYWDQSGRSDYDHFHHTQHDQFSAIIDSYQRRSALVVAIGAWNLANAESLVTRANAGPLPPRRLGVILDGMRVTSISEQGVGLEAGLREGDLLLELDGGALTTLDSLRERMVEGVPTKVLTVDRDGGRLSFEVDWSTLDSERERIRRRRERVEHFGAEIFEGEHEPEQ